MGYGMLHWTGSNHLQGSENKKTPVYVSM